MSTPDYLALPDDDKPLPRAVDKVRQKLFPRTEKREALTKLLRELDWEQRLWLRALFKNSFNVMVTRKELNKLNLRTPKSYQVSRWCQNPKFVQARELYADLLYDTEAPSKSTILLRINKIAEYNAEEVDEFHQGEPTGRTSMRDGSLALKANELAGKHLQMFGEEKSSAREGPQFIVQIISKEDPTKIIDVTPGRVRVKSLEQSDLENVIDAEPVDGS